ncbi:hypothetical protein MKW92_034612, partial [Papaver armeniacum]
IRRSHTKMKLNFSSWKNSALQWRYRDICTKFSEIADRLAANDDEYSAINDWLIEMMNSLKIVDSSSTNHYFMANQEEEAEEDNDDEDDTDEEEEEACIKDPSCKKRKGRPRSLRLKAHRKRCAAEKLQ